MSELHGRAGDDVAHDDDDDDDGMLTRKKSGMLSSPSATAHANARDGKPPSSIGVSTRGARSHPATERFECNVCFEIAREPAVTPCGHLYCWGCIHRWLEGASVDMCAACPVCKARVSQEDLIPLYGLGADTSSPERRRNVQASSEEPFAAVTDSTRGLTGLLGFRFREGEELTSGQASQLFLSRVLLTIGTFAIVCLLII